MPTLNLATAHKYVKDYYAATLAAAYDVHDHYVLLPLPQMNDCPVRRALDKAVKDALNLDGEMVANIRRTLAAGPSVTGNATPACRQGKSHTVTNITTPSLRPRRKPAHPRGAASQHPQ